MPDMFAVKPTARGGKVKIYINVQRKYMHKMISVKVQGHGICEEDFTVKSLCGFSGVHVFKRKREGERDRVERRPFK